jgi:hypothetical protein
MVAFFLINGWEARDKKIVGKNGIEYFSVNIMLAVII